MGELKFFKNLLHLFCLNMYKQEEIKVMYFFFYNSLSEAQVVMGVRHRLPISKVESSIPGECTSEVTSDNIFFFGFFHKFNILSSAHTNTYE